jgi:hypothetical protein
MFNNLTRNVGSFDRFIRLLIAIAALYFGLVIYPSSTIGTVLLIVAAVMGVTGMLGFCGLYRLLRLNTNHSGESTPRH